MGFFNFGKPKIPMAEKQTNVTVSTIGETKLKQGIPTGLEFDVLATIKKLQPCTVYEVADDIHKPESKVRYTMQALLNKGWLDKI
jgi:hypothetical protein